MDSFHVVKEGAGVVPEFAGLRDIEELAFEGGRGIDIGLEGLKDGAVEAVLPEGAEGGGGGDTALGVGLECTFFLSSFAVWPFDAEFLDDF
jgi:hypothetical protein